MLTSFPNQISLVCGTGLPVCVPMRVRMAGLEGGGWTSPWQLSSSLTSPVVEALNVPHSTQVCVGG
jgi:hypothetical protein